MSLKSFVYPAIIERAGRNYSVYFPDLPGCVSVGDTIEKTALAAEEALSLHLEGMLDHGEALPKPSRIEDIRPSPSGKELARMLVRTEIGTKVIRLNITLDETVVVQADRNAAALGMTRSGFIASLIRENARPRLATGAFAKPKRRRAG